VSTGLVGAESSGRASATGVACVSTVTTLSGFAIGAAADSVPATGKVRVWKSRSGALGISRFSVVFCGCGGALPRNMGTKITASAISTAAPIRRCFKAESMSGSSTTGVNESARLYPLESAISVNLPPRQRGPGDEKRAECEDAIVRGGLGGRGIERRRDVRMFDMRNARHALAQLRGVES